MSNMKKMKIPAILAGTLLAASFLPGQSAPPRDLDDYAGRALKTFQVPGMALAIVKDGRVVVAKGYGVKTMGAANPVDADTLFAIGSNTKAFTTAILASLADEGQLAWDDPVSRHLPAFRMYDPYVSQEMTIRDLVTHRSGLGLGMGDLLFWPQTTFSRDDIVHKIRFMKPASSFRSRYAYDNLLYVAAGQIIERLTGRTWEDVVRERVLAPLGMVKTNLSCTAYGPGDNFARPHTSIGGPLRPIDFVPLDNCAPAGSINSSAAEMARWALLQLDRGKFPGGGRRLFSAASSREMWSAQTIVPIGESRGPLAALAPKFSAYGLGWFLRDYHGRKLVGHTGGVAGFISRVMLVPEENLGVVVLTNSETNLIDVLLYRILDAYFALPPTDWIAAFKAANDQAAQAAAEAVKAAEAARAADSRPSLLPEKYAGVYEDAWYGPATLRMESGKLVFRLDHTPRAVGDVEHWQYDTFKVRWRDRIMEDAFLTFALDADGGIDHLTLKAVSPLADFSFDYQDLWFTKRKRG